MTTLRVGVTVLPELPWREAEPRWRAVEDLGFDHGWTYDHLVWGGLPQSPWYGTTPTLTAAALVTRRIGLGTFVTSPNFRHPVALHRDVQSLDDVSGGRFVLAAGAGATDIDARILGVPPLSARERADRFHEFVRLAKKLRDEDHVTQEGAGSPPTTRARSRAWRACRSSSPGAARAASTSPPRSATAG